MTLIIADKTGLYADKRAIDTSTDFPLVKNKLFPAGINSSAVMGVSGKLPVKPDQELLALTEVIAGLSCLMDFAEKANPTPIFHTDRDMHDALTQIGLLWCNGWAFELGSPRLLFITRYHNVYYNGMAGAEDLPAPTGFFNPPESFLAVGSSAKPALVLERAGFDTPEIYKRCSQIDNMISQQCECVERTKLIEIAFLPFHRNAAMHAVRLLTSSDTTRLITVTQKAQAVRACIFYYYFMKELSRRRRIPGKTPRPFTERAKRKAYEWAFNLDIPLRNYTLEELVEVFKRITK